MGRSSNATRFGLNPRGLSYERTVAVAKAAEAAGFDNIAFSDRPPESNIEAWTLATAIGVQTDRIRLTHSTLNVPFRNAGMLAKMAASLDVITGGGRVLLTLGAGGQEKHYAGYGITLGTPAERYERLEDAVAILRGLWANESFTYEGKQLSVAEGVVDPKPVDGTIPIFLGAGKPRMMRLTGRVADGWIKNGGWPESVEAYREQVALLEAGADSAGRDPAALHRVVNCTAYVGAADPASLMPQTLGTRGGIMGTADQVLEQVETWREAGADTFHVQFVGDMIDEQIPAFGEEVIARLRR